MIPILVTGGAGYIGAHTCKFLRSSGYFPVTVDNLVTGHRDFVRWGPFIEGDVRETSLIVNIINEYKPVAVIHFAASSAVSESTKDPLKYFHNNVGGALSVLDAMNICGLRHLVFSSTCAIYGDINQTPITENARRRPVNPYGLSKLIVEDMLSEVAKIQNIKYVSLRYFNAAGADPDGEIGEFHQPETHLIPLAIESGLYGGRLAVFGNDFNTKDGTAIRDYVHVSDLATAHLCAVKYLLNGGSSDYFNVGNGIGTSVLEIINLLIGLGVKIDYKYEARRPGDAAVLIASNKKAKLNLCWQPKYGINDILITALAWQKQRII